MVRQDNDILPEQLSKTAAGLGRVIAEAAQGDLSGMDEQVKSDLSKLQQDAKAFVEGIEEWFGALRNKNAHRDEEHLRRARHEARNQLNHLFGIVQLLQMASLPPEILDRMREAIGMLEECLALVAGTAEPPVLDRASSASESLIPPSAKNGGLILVADDDPSNREILERLLGPQGFDVEFAKNGREAIERIELQAYDAVLL
ncbi:MAG: response regulator, partial [Verrucomicrobiota bacterium]